jgi:mRNA interferase MazF
MMDSPTFERYGVYYADLNPTQGSEINKVRPVVIISMDEMNAALETVVVCPLTTKLHPHWRSRIQIKCAGKRSEIAVDQIRAISKSRLRKKIDQLMPRNTSELRSLISEMFGAA